MMFIRHLAVLGALAALAMASPSSIRKTASQSTTPAYKLYDEGCPCFKKKDITFLLALAQTQTDGGSWCKYDYNTGSESNSFRLEASGVKDSVTHVRYELYDNLEGDTDACSLHKATSVPDPRSSYVSVENGAYVYLDGSFEGTTKNCEKLLDIEAVKTNCTSVDWN